MCCACPRRRCGSCPCRRRCGQRSEEHTSELQSHHDLVCRLLLRSHPTSTLFPYTTLFRSQEFHNDAERRHLPRPPRSAEPGPEAAAGDDGDHHVSDRGQSGCAARARGGVAVHALADAGAGRDRKSTRLNFSHITISYAVFCFDLTLLLPSFPTRRSSDLKNSTTTQNVVTYPVLLEAPNRDLKLLPGMTATITFPIEAKVDVLRVPAAALRFMPLPTQVRAEIGRAHV